MKIPRAKVVLVAFVAFLIVLVVLADSGHGEQLFRLAGKIPAGDKVGHFMLFGVLSFLVNLILGAAFVNLRGITVLKGSAIVATVVTVEEFSQLFFRSRSFDLADLTADLLGIWVCGWLATKYLIWKRGRSRATPKTF